MERIKTLNTRSLCESAKKGGCGECQTSCQSACKTSCGVANQKCESTNKSAVFTACEKNAAGFGGILYRNICGGTSLWYTSIN